MSTEARVTKLEQAMAELAQAQARTQANLDRLSDEMRAFKDEMHLFKEESRADRQAANKQWGELANKMGTLVEDVVAPSIPDAFRAAFGLDPVECLIRQKPRHRDDPGRRREWDVVAWGGDVFLVNETRSRLTPADVTEFVAVVPESRAYFPEIEGRRLVGALASFYVDPSVVAAGERQGLLMFDLGGGLLEVLNGPGFKPRGF